MLVDVESVLFTLGLEGEVRGDEFNGPCPMHEARVGKPDNSPSWGINLTTGKHLCFSCGYSGGLTLLVADVKFPRSFGTHGSLEKAARWLEDFQISDDILMRSVQALNESTYRPPVDDIPMTEARLAVFTAPPSEALAKRRITADAAAMFGVRWETATDSWIFPVRDPHTFELWGWEIKGSTQRRHLMYPQNITKGQTLFGIELFDTNSTVVVVESPLDAVLLADLGLPALATRGTAVTRYQLDLLIGYQKVVVAMDNDVAGRKVSSRLDTYLSDNGCDVRVVEYGRYPHQTGKDFGEWSDPDDIRDAVANAKTRYQILLGI